MVDSLPRSFTPKEVSTHLRVRVQAVLKWISTGELLAYNVGTRRDGGRPRWRIPQPALEAFERSRSTQPKAPAPPKRRKATTNPKTFQFFR